MNYRRLSLTQSQRDCVLQPRVARHELPWVNVHQTRQPQRGCARPEELAVRVKTGDVATPLGLDFFSRILPRVARASQPWALRRNPDGILITVTSAAVDGFAGSGRSEERRVGKECGYQCRSRWSPYH